jgi:hypothetical protein
MADKMADSVDWQKETEIERCFAFLRLWRIFAATAWCLVVQGAFREPKPIP